MQGRPAHRPPGTSLPTLYPPWAPPSTCLITGSPPVFAPDNVNPADMDQDINAGKLLQFTAAAPRNPNGGVNDYTGSDKPRTGIVQNTLQNGYPVLSQGDRSLAYLFNPNLANAGKASFPGVRNLLQIDDQR